MRYVSVAAPLNKAQLNRYVRAVRSAGRGMGQNGDGDFGGETGGDGDFGGETGAPVLPQTPILSTTDLSQLPTGLPSSSVTTISDQNPLSVFSSELANASAAATSPAAGGGFNLTAFMNALAGGAAAGAKVYQSTQSPSLIPGTNAIYNPATGQILNAANLTSLTSSLTSALPTILIFGGIGLVAFFVISSMGKH
jgi:hypothetical protein